MKFEELKRKIESAGVVGAGGAGFPTHVKLNKEAEYVLINGTECEPLLRVDRQLMACFASKIVKILAVLVESMEAKVGIIALKKKYVYAVRELTPLLSKYDNLDIHILPDIYPSGDEVMVVYETTQRIVSRGAIPIEQKAVVINVETALNIYQAVFEEDVVTHTYVTVSGAVKKPSTFYAPVGISAQELIELAGGKLQRDSALIVGGPMTGKVMPMSSSINKSTKGLIVLPRTHSLIRKKESITMSSMRKIMSACSQCRMCTDLCPRNLIGHDVQPHKLMNAIANGLVKNSSVIDTALGCCSCGICEMYACHQGLSPRQFMQEVKKELMKKGVSPKRQSKGKVSKYRNQRLVPAKRLLTRLGLGPYNVDAPIKKGEITTEKVEILIDAYIGKASIPIVQVGEYVKEGQCIAAIPEGALGCNMHASIEGIVTYIDKSKICIERGKGQNEGKVDRIH